jgi:hypothetical protein
MTGTGDTAPRFELPDTDGDPRALETPAVVVFTCNHCPYALAWHDRLMDVARDYEDVHFYAINPNDAERYPRDSFEAMKERVANGEFAGPYLHDETQDVARSFGAKTTPDVFVVGPDGRLAYRGAPDADHGEPSLRAEWLRAALDDLLAGRPVGRPETKPVGCSVKWRP